MRKWRESWVVLCHMRKSWSVLYETLLSWVNGPVRCSKHDHHLDLHLHSSSWWVLPLTSVFKTIFYKLRNTQCVRSVSDKEQSRSSFSLSVYLSHHLSKTCLCSVSVTRILQPTLSNWIVWSKKISELRVGLLLPYTPSSFTAGVSAVTTVTGHRGHSVQIRCSYESGYETYMKYLCRGACSTLPWGTKDIPVQSGSTAEDQRFSLDDDTAARVFTITITDLRPEDGGTYWCGIQRPKPLPDIYTEVLLQVKQGE